MRLLSATVRNYRIHCDLTVNFDQKRTLIGGPNESGKSTLVEAIHRALFLKATVTGEALASMASTCHPGHPEVEVRFEARGAEYHLFKRFSGQSGLCRLTQIGGETWQGEEAESRLAGLLTVDEVTGGRGILDRVNKQWAHLWVWQGQSSDDIGEHIEAQQTALLRQLQQFGGAVAMQSALDSRVATRFAQAREQIFTLAGKPKKGSDLDSAQSEFRQAEEACAQASTRLSGLRQAVEDFEAASSAIVRTTKDLDEIGRQQQGLREKIAQVDELRRAEEKQATALTAAAEKTANLERIENNITDLRTAIEELRQRLEPKIEQQILLESKLAEARKNKGEADQTYDRALARTRAARATKEAAATFVACFQAEVRCRDLEARLERVQGLQDELEEIRRQMAQLPSIDQRDLETLQTLENDIARASAAVTAMATEVEVITADLPVQVGDIQVAPGESRTISDLTDVTVGEGVHLRIHPGGGDSLARVRADLRERQENLRRALAIHGLNSVGQAAEMVLRRVDLRSQQESKEAALGEWDADNLLALHRQAEEELAAKKAESKRRLSELSNIETPATLAEAEAWLSRETEILRQVESDEISCKATLDALAEQTVEREKGASDFRETIKEEQQNLTGLSAQLELLLTSHGDDDSRARLLIEAQQTKAEVELKLAETRKALEALQPDLLEADHERLQRAQSETDRQKRDAETKRAVAQAALRSDGADDPYAQLAQAEAWRDTAGEHLQSVGRKAQAIVLVDDLFKEEQQALADQFSRPLAERIEAYLQCLFGADARAEVTFENNAFKGIRIARPTRAEVVGTGSLSGTGLSVGAAPAAGAESFDSLSEGAREQVAAAVRLAMAELLAVDHDGSLPVVFDDAFAYSDPERVRTLQRMLELGAGHGLQIIILTCDPSDYATLGAQQTTLR